MRLQKTFIRVAQRGLGLIELMISMVLGIAIVGAMIVVYLSADTSNRQAQAQAQLNEDAQMALDVLTAELRNAGYNPANAAGERNDLAQGGWTLRACDQGFVDDKVATMDLLSCAASGTPAIAVAYEADVYSGPLTNGSPRLPRDCAGNGVNAASATVPAYFLIQSRLWVQDVALKCRGSGALSQEPSLAENIESVSFRFAVADPASASQEARGYLSATELDAPADPALAALPPLERWNKVVAVRVCVVAVSQTAVLHELRTASAAPTYIGCDDAVKSIADGKLRRAFRTTVVLRNHGVGHGAA